MKLKDYIINILEGGNAVTCEPIPGNLAIPVFLEFKTMMSEWDIEPIGATGKKTDKMFNGDIDTAIKEKWSNLKKITKILDSNELEYVENPGLGIISVSYPYLNHGEKKYVQIDMMFTDNLPLSKFRFWSPDFTKNESEYKGAVRTLLIIDIIGSIPVDDSEEYFSDEYDGKYKGQVKKMWKHIVAQGGELKKVCVDFSGKTKPLMKAKKLAELDKIITSTPEDFWSFMFDGDINMDDFNSFESLWKAINSPKFKYPELINNIKERFKKSLDKINVQVKGINY